MKKLFLFAIFAPLMCFGSGEVGFSVGRNSVWTNTYKGYLNVYEPISAPYYFNFYAQYDYNLWGVSYFGKFDINRHFGEKIIVGAGARYYLANQWEASEIALSFVIKLW